MNPVATENKPEPKIEQTQTVTRQAMQENQKPASEENAGISEENKPNFKAFREQREADRKAREASDRRATEKAAEAEALKAALEASLNRTSNNRQMNDSDSGDIEETEEQRIDRRVELAIKQREAKAEKERYEREQREYPDRLLSTFNDFNHVCTSENLDYLEFHYPEVAAPYKHVADGYDKWASIYKAVKRFVPNVDSRKDQAKADRNLAKPGSISSAGTTQGTGTMPSTKLTEERKAENWARMQRDRRGLN